MPFPLITAEQLQYRLGDIQLTRAFDDENIGQPSEDPLNQLIRDASSKVLGRLKGMYPVDAIRAMAIEDMDEELTRVTLDQASAMARQRHPEVFRTEWESYMKQADRELEDLRKNAKGLAREGAPEPPANVGGGIQGSADGAARPETFGCGFGGF